MKLRLPVRLKLAVTAGLRSVVHATVASGALAVGAALLSFAGAQEQEDPQAVPVDEEEEVAVALEDEAADEVTDDSQAAALEDSLQEHAAELGINAGSDVTSQAAIEGQDAAVLPTQAAGGGHADSAATVEALASDDFSVSAAEGAVAPSLCAEGAAAITDTTLNKTTSAATLQDSLTDEDAAASSTSVVDADSLLSGSSDSSSSSPVSGGSSAASSLLTSSASGGSSSSPAAASYSLKTLGSAGEASAESTPVVQSDTVSTASNSKNVTHTLSGSGVTHIDKRGYADSAWTANLKDVANGMTSTGGVTVGQLFGSGNKGSISTTGNNNWIDYESAGFSSENQSFRLFGRNGVSGEWMGSAYALQFGENGLLTDANEISTSVSLTISGTLAPADDSLKYILQTGIVQVLNGTATLLGTEGSSELTVFSGTDLILSANASCKGFLYDSSATYYAVFRIAGTGATATSYNTVTLGSWSTTSTAHVLTWIGSSGGEWSTSAANWVDAGGETQLVYIDRSDAVFSSTGDYTISLAGNIQAGSVSVENGNYVFSKPEAGASSLAAAAITVGNDATLILETDVTVGSLSGSATVKGNLNLMGEDGVYHTGGALTFEDGSTLKLGDAYLNCGKYAVGIIEGSILNGASVALSGLRSGYLASYADGTITVSSSYGWTGSAPSKSDVGIVYPDEETTSGGALSAEFNTFYSLSSNVTDLTAGDSDIKINSVNNNAGYTASGTWEAGSVWLNSGLLKAVSGFNVDSLGALYVTGAQLRLSSEGLTLNPGKLYLGGKSGCTDTAYTDATLAAANSATVACDVEVVADTKITVQNSKVLTFSGRVNSADRKVVFVGATSSGAKVEFLSDTTFGQIGVSTFPSEMTGFDDQKKGYGITLCFRSGVSEVSDILLYQPSTHSNGIEIGGGTSSASLTVTGGISGNNGYSTVKVLDKGSLKVATYSASDPLSVASGGSLEVTTLSGTATLNNSGIAKVTTHSGSGAITNNSGGNLTVTTLSGTATLNNSGTAEVGEYSSTGTIENNGTLTILDKFVTCSGMTLAGIMNIGSAEKAAEVILGGVLYNTGTLSLNASIIEYQGDVGLSGMSDTTFKDDRSSETTNGFLQKGTCVFIRNEGTLTLNKGITEVRVNGVDCELTKSDDGSTYSFTLTDTNLADLSGSYFINSGTLVYGADTNQTADMKTEALVLNGGGLSLTTSDIHVGVGLSVVG
ncbi:MAG: beta strand repeat-containing protein [Akkermansia sp.]